MQRVVQLLQLAASSRPSPLGRSDTQHLAPFVLAQSSRCRYTCCAPGIGSPTRLENDGRAPRCSWRSRWACSLGSWSSISAGRRMMRDCPRLRYTLSSTVPSLAPLATRVVGRDTHHGATVDIGGRSATPVALGRRQATHPCTSLPSASARRAGTTRVSRAALHLSRRQRTPPALPKGRSPIPRHHSALYNCCHTLRGRARPHPRSR